MALQVRFLCKKMFPRNFQVASQLLLGCQTKMNRGKNKIDIPGCHSHPICDPGRIISLFTQKKDCNPSCINGLLESPLAEDLTRSQICCLSNCIDYFLQVFVHDFCFPASYHRLCQKKRGWSETILSFYLITLPS